MADDSSHVQFVAGKLVAAQFIVGFYKGHTQSVCKPKNEQEISGMRT